MVSPERRKVESVFYTDVGFYLQNFVVCVNFVVFMECNLTIYNVCFSSAHSDLFIN